jgi:hypothetical protein
LIAAQTALQTFNQSKPQQIGATDETIHPEEGAADVTTAAVSFAAMDLTFDDYSNVAAAAPTSAPTDPVAVQHGAELAASLAPLWVAVTGAASKSTRQAARQQIKAKVIQIRTELATARKVSRSGLDTLNTDKSTTDHSKAVATASMVQARSMLQAFNKAKPGQWQPTYASTNMHLHHGLLIVHTTPSPTMRATTHSLKVRRVQIAHVFLFFISRSFKLSIKSTFLPMVFLFKCPSKLRLKHCPISNLPTYPFP